MMHAGFAAFFLLSLLVTVVALARAAAQNLGRIRRALDGSVTVEESASEFRLKVCRTAEVPRIAARLGVKFPDGLTPVLHVPRAWPFEREDPSFS
jgi:hypothetical protein